MYRQLITPLFALFFVAFCGWSSQAMADDGGAVFIDLAQAVSLIEEGATILDARERADFEKAHIPGAKNLPWQLFVEGQASGALVDSDEHHQTVLQNAGISAQRPALIYGNWSATGAWGEEGRLFWTLEYFDHPRVYILEGGLRAWERAERPIEKGAAPKDSAEPGDFEIRRQPSRRTSTAELAQSLSSTKAPIILDSRERAEFEGQVKYGESRAGHIPGARHLDWRDLFDEGGDLRAADDLRRVLASFGATSTSPVVAYCTGGIRSGFVYAVLRHLGFEKVQNYDASMWDWTRDPALPLQ